MSDKYSNWILKTPKGSDERYTPKWIFNGLKLKFNIDVAAPVGGCPNVPSKRHFSIENDGLKSKWSGLVWCNPPYSNPTPWMEKFRKHGNGVALVPTSNGRWFHELYSDPNVVMRPIPKMKFEFPDGTTLPGTTPFVCWLVGIGDKGRKAVLDIKM